MSLVITCPECQVCYPLSAGLLTDDGKALGIRLADAPRDLARNVVSYLRLHKPAKRALSLKRSYEIANEVLTLALADVVEWEGNTASNNPNHWILTIESLLAKPPKKLPLGNTNYLRSAVFERAAQAEQTALKEALDAVDKDHRTRESDARSGFLSGGNSPSPAQTPAERAQAKAEFERMQARLRG